MLPDFERADRIGEFWGYQESRAIALVMFSPWAKAYQTPDSPLGWTQAEQDKRDLHVAEDWGTTAFARWNVSMFAPGTSATQPSSKRWPAIGGHARASPLSGQSTRCTRRSMHVRSSGQSTCRHS